MQTFLMLLKTQVAGADFFRQSAALTCPTRAHLLAAIGFAI
jgi:hypothetical protein